MKTLRTKYPIKIGSVLYPQNTVVDLPLRKDDTIQSRFPDISFNESSPYIMVIFPNQTSPTICLKKQFVD